MAEQQRNTVKHPVAVSSPLQMTYPCRTCRQTRQLHGHSVWTQTGKLRHDTAVKGRWQWHGRAGGSKASGPQHIASQRHTACQGFLGTRRSSLSQRGGVDDGFCATQGQSVNQGRMRLISPAASHSGQAARININQKHIGRSHYRGLGQGRVVHHPLQRLQCTHQPQSAHQYESDCRTDPPVQSPCFWLALRCVSGHLQSMCKSVNVCKKANFTPAQTGLPNPAETGLSHVFGGRIRRRCRSLSDTPRSATKLSTPPHLCVPQTDRTEIAKAKKSTRHQIGSGCFQHLCKAARGRPRWALITSVGP